MKDSDRTVVRSSQYGYGSGWNLRACAEEYEYDRMMRTYYDQPTAMDRLGTGGTEQAHERDRGRPQPGTARWWARVLLLPSSPPRVEVRAPMTTIGMPVPAARVEQTGTVSSVVPRFRGSRYASGGKGAKRYQRQQ